MDRDDQPLAIKLTNISKKYRIFDTPGDRIREALSPFRKTYHSEFWALKNINLDIKKGQTVGIVGRNGSGKSTLLQLLAGILQPTEGHIEIHGDIAALLELGTGFNPELTGRENVSLYHAIMKRPDADMVAATAFIEDFADIGDFYDHPVKTYSTGMFARLAFAAAIATDPDILIIDEILGVGDARFLQKSFRHIQKMHEEGATLLIVSHDAELILKLCDTVVYIDSGEVVFTGKPHKAMSLYHEKLFRDDSDQKLQVVEMPDVEATPMASLADIAENVPESVKPLLAAGSAMHIGMPSYNKEEDIINNVGAQIEDFIVLAEGLPNFVTLAGTEEIEIYFKVRFDVDFFSPHIGLGIVTAEGVMLAGSNTHIQGKILPTVRAGEIGIYRASVKINLNSGDYFLNFGLMSDKDGILSMLSVRRHAIHLNISRDSACSGFLRLPFDLESLAPLKK